MFTLSGLGRWVPVVFRGNMFKPTGVMTSQSPDEWGSRLITTGLPLVRRGRYTFSRTFPNGVLLEGSGTFNHFQPASPFPRTGILLRGKCVCARWEWGGFLGSGGS